MAVNSSPLNVATIFQTKGQTHDVALTGNAPLEDRGQYIFSCAANAMSRIAKNDILPFVEDKVRSKPNLFNCDLLRLQLLIREKIAHNSIKTIAEIISSNRLLPVTFDVGEYMRLAGYSDTDIAQSSTKANVVRNINKALLVLEKMQFAIPLKRNSFCRFHVIAATVKSGDVFTLKISPDFLQLVVSSAIYQKHKENALGRGLYSKFSRAIYELNSCTEMKVLYYLETHYSMLANHRKNVHNHITIGSIARFLCLPASKEAVRSRKTTNYYRLMVQPVIKALESLKVKGLIDYSLQEEGKPVSDSRFLELKHSPELLLKVVVLFKSVSLDSSSSM